MKTVKSTLIVCLLAIFVAIVGCTKEGPSGKDGNANVKVFYFANDSLSNTHEFVRELPLSGGYIDSSLVLAYYIDKTVTSYWYSSPGLGSYSAYQTRFIIERDVVSTSKFYLKVNSPSGGIYTGTVLLDKVKVVVVKGGSFTGKKDPVDYSNYKATMKYYGIEE
jgi:hypothetical protein